jgi:hypothetical protein
VPTNPTRHWNSPKYASDDSGNDDRAVDQPTPPAPGLARGNEVPAVGAPQGDDHVASTSSRTDFGDDGLGWQTALGVDGDVDADLVALANDHQGRFAR